MIKTKVMREIEPEWERLMRLVDVIGHGEILLTVQNKKPVMAEQCVKKIKLGNDEDFMNKIIPLT